MCGLGDLFSFSGTMVTIMPRAARGAPAPRRGGVSLSPRRSRLRSHTRAPPSPAAAWSTACEGSSDTPHLRSQLDACLACTPLSHSKHATSPATYHAHSGGFDVCHDHDHADSTHASSGPGVA